MGSRLENKSAQVRKRIENHTFDNEEGEEYEASKFGGFNDYFRRKKIKLQNLDVDLRAKSADKPQIFRGVVAHVNGYTQPSLNDLHAMLVSHGAGFVQYLDGKTMVTHIIASSLTPKKAVEFKRYRMVKPAWVVDSVQAGRLLPWDSYRVVDEGVGQKVLAFDNGQITSQVNKQVKGYREQSDASWYTSQLQPFLPTAGQGSPLLSPDLAPTPEVEDTRASGADDPSASSGLQVSDLSDLLPSVGSDIGPAAADQQTAASPNTIPLESELDGVTLALDTAVEKDDQTTANESTYAEQQLRGTKRSLEDAPVSPRKATKLTAEEHNAILLADPRLRMSTVVNPDFLEQYYRESRLHHLSTWKADLKAQLQSIAAEKSSSQKALSKRRPGSRRYIMHVDFDSFFAAVSLKKNPEYKDVPAVVAHGPGSGSEIASCNYPARKFGISNGMWMKKALELYPELKVLPYDFPAYEEASRKFYDVILATGGIVQSVSIDEALVDISDKCISASGSDGVHRSEGSNWREQSRADKIAKDLRDRVFELTECHVSVGIGGNILQAKLALRKAKPAGQHQVKPEEVLDFIAGLEVQSLPGVAFSIAGKLEEIGIKLVKDIRETSKERLIRTLGPKTGEKIYEYARGIDRTEVGDQIMRKSVSAEVNWGVRFENQEQVDEFIQSLCGELQRRLLKEGVKGRQLTMKVMRRSPDAPLDPPKHLGHGKCDTYNKSLQLGVATNDVDTIAKEALATMRGFGFTPGELRGLGVQMTKLEPIKTGPDGRADSSQQRLLFKRPEAPIAKQAVVGDPITDDIETPKKNRVRDVYQPAIPFSLSTNKSPSRRPMNMLGTQFIVPTQIDPKVLAELPAELRVKLMQQMGSKNVVAREDDQDTSRATQTVSRAHSPTPGKLDEDFLDSLPEDIRAEVRAMYRTSPRKAGAQSLLPQSPRKNRALPPPPRKPLTKKRGGGLFGRKSVFGKSSSSTLTQANFVARASTDTDGESTIPGIDEAFLQDLPEALREEVLEQHRAAQLRRAGGIEVSVQARNRLKQRQKAQQQPDNSIEAYFLPPPRKPKPQFMKKYSSIEELRQVLQAWVRGFNDESPYDEDVDALQAYLHDVVVDERDVDKAVKAAKWLSWVVGEEVESRPPDTQCAEAWSEALLRVQNGIQQAMTQRGLNEVDFG
ncbi:hypothetical protein AAFC00_001151 [Neodothiora populina]|uniref:DNA repair protein REV1 n=1 Tax=Neodothiora populina TaxID=2781224 RepID=A0ABR3PNC7_9PEZI